MTFTQTIGWYGITFRAPEDWSIGAIGGNREAGYLRVDDLVATRLELKWQRAGASVSLQPILDKYLKEVARQARRRRVALHTKTDVKLLRRKKKPTLIQFTWRSDRQGCGVIWKCDECDRILLAQLSGSNSENLLPTAQRVLGSLEDHGEDGWETWSLYGFRFEIPDQFTLARQKLLTGQIELEFTRGQTERIFVMRWSRAAALVKSDALAAWACASLQAAMKSIRFDCNPDVINTHAGVRLTGRTQPLAQRVKEKTAQAILRRRPPVVQGYSWRCAEEDKLFAVGCVVSAEHAFLPRDIAESVVCHE